MRYLRHRTWAIRRRPTATRGTVVAGVLLAVALVLTGGALPSAAFGEGAVVSAPEAFNRCNGTENDSGRELRCYVNVNNTLDQATGATSSTTSIMECHGWAHTTGTCQSWTTASDQLITSVDQCNGSGNGGGSTVSCIASINNIVGPVTTAPATFDQCNGSGEGGGTDPTVACDPVGAATDATMTQCDDAANGGGDARRVVCFIAPSSTETLVLPVTINQCNGSGNGGGGTVNCVAGVTTNEPEPPIQPPSPPPPPYTPPPPGTPPPPPTIPPPPPTPPPTPPPPHARRPRPRRRPTRTAAGRSISRATRTGHCRSIVRAGGTGGGRHPDSQSMARR